MKNFRAAFQSFAGDRFVRTCENPLSGKILIVSRPAGTTCELVEVAMEYLTSALYSDRNIEISMMDNRGRPAIIACAPENRAQDANAITLFSRMMDMRTGGTYPSIFLVEKIENGEIHAALPEWGCQSLYTTILEAGHLSRRNNAQPVLFDFNGKQLRVLPDTRVEDILYLLPAADHIRKSGAPKAPKP